MFHLVLGSIATVTFYFNGNELKYFIIYDQNFEKINFNLFVTLLEYNYYYLIVFETDVHIKYFFIRENALGVIM